MATSGTGGTAATTDDGTGTAVALEDVRKTYQLGEPVHALDGVSLEIPRGSYTAIMSGLTGWNSPSSGRYGRTESQLSRA